jgi:VWFA-related protein
MASAKRAVTLLLSGLLSGSLAPGATEKTSPPPPETPRSSPLIETTTSELVLIELYVRDRKGNPVRDLKVSDLTLKIDGKGGPRPITSLEWIEPPQGVAPPAAGGAPGATPPAGAPAAAPSTAAAPPPASAPRSHADWPRRFMLFFDDATSSPTQMTAARKAAIAFLERPGRPSDQFGLASYSQKRRLEILHDFTSDRTALRAILDASLKDNVRMSDFGTERNERLAEMDRKEREARQSSAVSPVAMEQQVQQMARAGATQDGEVMRRVLSSMSTLVEAISTWPGYKAVVYVGEGVPENPADDYGLNDPRLALTQDIGDLAMSAGSANVTLHSVQTEGVVAGGAGTVAAASRRSNTLATMALDTGGTTTTSNDLLGALATVEKSSEGYYLLAYAPEGPPDGAIHSVEIRASNRSLVLRYRRQFTRWLPEEARTRALQAAYIAPELHGDMRLDLAVVRGPVAGSDRLFDVVLYVPPEQILFVPQPGGPLARLDVGFVVIDASGRETLRLARRVNLTPGGPRAPGEKALAIDFFTRVRLPDRDQTITAVVADAQSGTIGAARLLYKAETAGAGATGVSLYSLDERSLWVEVAAAAAGDKPDAERASATTVGPALRTGFSPFERVSCGFRTPAPAAAGDPPGLRLVVLRGDDVVRTRNVDETAKGERADPGTHGADLPIDGLADGEYVLRIDEMRPEGPVEIGRARFRIEAPAGG